MRLQASVTMGMVRRRMVYGGVVLSRMPKPVCRVLWCCGEVFSSCVSRLSMCVHGGSVWKVAVGSRMSGARVAARSGVMPMCRLCMVLRMEYAVRLVSGDREWKRAWVNFVQIFFGTNRIFMLLSQNFL